MTATNKDHEINRDIYLTAKQFFFIGEKDSCWPWFGSFDTRGTPRFKKNGIYYKARRVILLDYLNLKQSNLWPLPTPDCKMTPNCMNPNHMFLGTPKQSTSILVDSGRHDCLNRKGENHPMHNLTDEKVLNIRKEFENGATYTELSHKYEVAYSEIIQIINRRLWGHI